jgi:hypothetical protein
MRGYLRILITYSTSGARQIWHQHSKSLQCFRLRCKVDKKFQKSVETFFEGVLLFFNTWFDLKGASYLALELSTASEPQLFVVYCLLLFIFMFRELCSMRNCILVLHFWLLSLFSFLFEFVFVFVWVCWKYKN